MATTTTVDISALVPAAVTSRVLEAYTAATTLEGYAETDDTLRGVAAGDSVTIGSFAGATPALNLTETEEIVPKKHTATVRSFTVQRIGDAYSYSYRSRRATTSDLEDRSTRYLGSAFAQRVDLNLASTALSAVDPARKITSTGVITPADFIAAVRTFNDEDLGGVVAVLSSGQRNALTDAVLAGGTTYTGNTVWSQGAISSFYGVPIETNARLAQTTAGRVAALFLVRGETLISAPAQDPEVEYERFPRTASINAVMNAWWAGGVQDLAKLTVIDATR